MPITANWSYPTAVKLGAGRIRELADHCKALGMKRPLLVTDRGLASMAITANALAPMLPVESMKDCVNFSPANAPVLLGPPGVAAMKMLKETGPVVTLVASGPPVSYVSKS